MGHRLFPDNDAWSDEASRAGNNVTVDMMNLLELLEQDGPVDLRDFHYIVTQAVSTFVSQMSLLRRFEGESAKPNPVWRHYPQLEAKDSVMIEVGEGR